MGTVYVAINPAFPDRVKIGRTTQPIERRMRGLDTTGVPEPYKCVAAWEFDDHKGAEKALHEAFKDFLHNKEFYTVKVDRILPLLKQFGTREVPIPKERQYHPPKPPKRPPRRLSDLGIAPGEILTSIWDTNITCKVVNDKKVEFAGAVMSLTKAAEQVLRGRGKTYSVSGPASWCYGDPPKRLDKLRDELELSASNRGP